MPATALLTVSDFEARCREVFPRPLFETLFGSHGSPEFESLTNNLDAFRRRHLRPRVLAGVEHRNLCTSVLGQPLEFPVMIAPTGLMQRCDPEGELAIARAAGAMGTIMALSTASNYSIEEVAEAASGGVWYQLYFFRDRELNTLLVRRAEQAGYRAIILTADNVTERTWEREYRYDAAATGAGSLQKPRSATLRQTHMEPGRSYRNFAGMDRPDLPNAENFHEVLEKNLNWSDLDWLCSTTSLPVVVKGIQTAEDAALCVEHGAAGLIVSNHGGHTVNGLKGTLDTLPEVVDAVAGRIEVYLDGGVRRGTDVMKALALGARAVFIGRPVFWGLIVGGEEGVRSILTILKNERFIETGRCGVADLATIDRRWVD